MRIGLIISVASAQVLSVILSLLFYYYVWPAPPRWAGSHFVEAGAPYLMWIPPLAVYLLAGVALQSDRKRLNWILAAMIGSILIVGGYEFLLQILDGWERQHRLEFLEQCRRSPTPEPLCRFGISTAYPPPPPRYWERAVAAYFMAMAALYLMLHISEWRARRS